MCCVNHEPSLRRLEKHCEKGPIRYWKVLSCEYGRICTFSLRRPVYGPGTMYCDLHSRKYDAERPHGIHVYRKRPLQAWYPFNARIVPVHCRAPIACEQYWWPNPEAVFLDVEIRKEDWDRYVLRKK